MAPERPQGEELWIPIHGQWQLFVRCQDELWIGPPGEWERLTGSTRVDYERLFLEYEMNRLAHFLPHGEGLNFLNDWTNGICLLVGPSRGGKSAHGVGFGLLRTIECDERWPVFMQNGVKYHEYRGRRRLVVSSYSWGNVEELWLEYRKWIPRKLLGPFAEGWGCGKFPGESGSQRFITFDSGKSQRLRLTSGDEIVFLADGQKQSAWEGKRWDDHHVDEQREREKWIGYLRGTANTKGLVQAGLTLTGHILPERPDTGTAGWVYNDLWLGAYNYGRTVGKYQLSMEDVPDAVLAPEKKAELHRQWVEEPTKNQDEEMLRKGKARYFGGWESGGGLVIQTFDPATHIIPDIRMDHPICRDATKYRAIDHGLSRPCACMLGAVFPWGDILIYREYYERGKTVPYHAAKIVELCGNKVVPGDMGENEGTIEPIRLYQEQVDGTRFESSVLDGRSFNSPCQERSVTLGQLYNDCGLECTPANMGHGFRNSDSGGIIPNMLRYFTKIEARPHLMWQLWKRKIVDEDAYRAWLAARCGDWQHGSTIYFVRSLRWTFDELHKWSLDRRTGLPETKANDHLMACLRYITAENPVYRGNNWQDDGVIWGEDEEENEVSTEGGARYVGYYTD